MIRHPTATASAGNHGSALVLALLVIATLTGLAVAFSGSARTEVSLAAFSRDALRAEALARAAVEAALQEIAADEDLDKDDFEEDWGLVDGTTVPLELPEEAALTGHIADESGKLNLNLLLNGSGGIDEEAAARVKRLFDLMGLGETACDSLLDWLDKDDIKRLDGAESFYYQGLESRYPCGNGPLLSVRQLALVRGLERLDGLGEEGDRHLPDYVTIFSDGKVNVNTAPAEVLQSLDEDMDRSLAEAVAQRRIEDPFSSVEEVGEVAGMEEAVFERIQPLLTVKTSVFGICFEAAWDDALCRIDAVAERDEDNIRWIYWKVD